LKNSGRFWFLFLFVFQQIFQGALADGPIAIEILTNVAVVLVPSRIIVLEARPHDDPSVSGLDEVNIIIT
jgi:hypothetical protein